MVVLDQSQYQIILSGTLTSFQSPSILSASLDLLRDDAMDVAYGLDVRRVHQSVQKKLPRKTTGQDSLLVEDVSWNRELE